MYLWLLLLVSELQALLTLRLLLSMLAWLMDRSALALECCDWGRAIWFDSPMEEVVAEPTGDELPSDGLGDM